MTKKDMTSPLRTIALLALAALLEAFGDSLFQSGLYRSAGVARGLFFVSGALVLALYGFTVNIPHWNFGKLLGIYVVLFFLVAQVLAKVRFNQAPTPPIFVGGTLIAPGGIIIAFWRGSASYLDVFFKPFRVQKFSGNTIP
jgi:small multidrug resistance family-3 protein